MLVIEQITICQQQVNVEYKAEIIGRTPGDSNTLDTKAVLL